MFMETDKSNVFRFLKEVDVNKYVGVLKTLSNKRSVELPTNPQLGLAYKITVNTVFIGGVADYGLLNGWLDQILSKEPEAQPVNIFLK